MSLDVPSLILTNALLSVVFTTVLLVSRISLGTGAGGIRTWVLGDLLLSTGRIVAAATVVGWPWARGLAFPVLPGALAVAGVTLHVFALRSVAGRPVPPRRALAWTVGLAALFHGVASATASLDHRIRLLDAALLASALATLWVLRPLLGFWGARLIAAMMALACVAQGLRFALVLAGVDAPFPQAAGADLRAVVRPGSMVLDLVISIVLTSGLLLLLQERLRARIERLVVTDALTGVLNRHGLMPMLGAALARAHRQHEPVSVVLFDLDHFKRVNDVHGHAVGDQVLAGFSAVIVAELRGSDVFGRWGGEEFLLLLPATDLRGARTLAERMRLRVAGTPLADPAVRVTVSAGVACVDGPQRQAAADDTQALLRLLDTADKRLYLAKRQRDCVVDADEDARSPAPVDPFEQAGEPRGLGRVELRGPRDAPLQVGAPVR